MKKYILFLTGLLFLASACNDDDVKGVIEPVTEVECSPFVGSVQMKWKNPASEDWYYTLISYKDADGRTVNKKVSRFSGSPDHTTTAFVGGFTDTNEYEFTLTTHGYSGASSVPVVVKGTPDDRSGAAAYVMESVQFEPKEAGARLSWVNETEIGVTLHVSYTNGLGMYMEEEVDATFTGDYAITDLVGKTTFIVRAENVADGTMTDESTYEASPIVDPRDVILIEPNLEKSYGIKSITPIEGEDNAYRYVFDYNAAERFILSVPMEQSLRRTDMMLVFQYKSSILARTQLMFMTNTGLRFDYDWNLPATDRWTTITLDIQKALEETKWGNAGNTFRILIWQEKGLPINEYTIDFRNMYMRPK